MYHYVRPDDPALPHFRHLSFNNFRRQLDHFAATDGFITRDEFLRAVESGECPGSGVVLTFDDGFRDHYDFVLPELQRRRLWGIFYVTTGVYSDDPRLLDVHRTHIMLGRHGGLRVMECLESVLRDDMLNEAHIAEFHNTTYVRHSDDEVTKQIKRILNYFMKYERRSEVIDFIAERLMPDERDLKSNFYLSESHLREMQRAGMVIGSHTVTHPVMSRLDVSRQRLEIDDSFSTLDRMVDGLTTRTFCYPYGGFRTFTTETEALLDAAGCRFSFNVEPREIETHDLRRRQALPRFDCNQWTFAAQAD